MFVVRLFNQSSGHVETVSQIFPDFPDENEHQRAYRRMAVVERFAAEDTATDDLFFSTSWPLEGSVA